MLKVYNRTSFPFRGNKLVCIFSKQYLSFSKTVNASESSIKSFILDARSVGDTTFENNTRTETNRLEKTLTKFWDKVETKHDKDANEYVICLDDKPLKTPLGYHLTLPAQKKKLAYLIGHEWANLPDLKVKTNSLPLTSITARSIDLSHVTNESNANEEQIAKIGNLEDIKLNLIRYLDTDTCLILATSDEYSGKLRKKQMELYFPLMKEFNDFFTTYAAKKGDLLPEKDDKVELTYLDCETHGLRGNRQSITTQNIVLDWLNSLPVFDLIALEKAILTSKSFLCGISLLRSNCSDSQLMKNLYQLNKAGPDQYFHKTIEEIIELGNLETIFQTQEWGEVEDTHDVDNADWLRSLTSAALLSH